MTQPLRFFSEVLGCTPVRLRVSQARTAIFGERDVPPSRVGLSSLSQLHPRIAWPLWRGQPVIARTTIITNLFNHTQTPIEAGWSVKRTQCEDFRGRQLTYDSHNGTDFSLPVGSTLVAPAPARVAHVVSEFNRGGLKVFLDHGAGLITSYAHLARCIVREGETLRAGDAFALSGYSGLDGFSTFPLGVPHVHMNVWLNGLPVDPFARDGETPLWRGGCGLPEATQSGAVARALPTTSLCHDAVEEMIEACVTATERERLRAESDPWRRAMLTIIASNYYPTRFPARPNPYEQVHGREARLSLPLRSEDYSAVMFLDEL